MTFLAYIRSLAARLLTRSQAEAEIEDELRSHIQHRADDLERGGVDRAEAERRARIEFGGYARFTEESRDALGGNLVDVLIKDTRLSVRLLRKSPAFSVVATLSLALAIGANAVVFGVLNGLILRPLNVPQAGSLYGIEHGTEHNMWESYPDYLDLRDRNRSFDGLAGFSIEQVAFDAGESATQSWVYAVTGNYFDVLRIQPHLGRLFHASDEHGAGSAPYIVLSHSYWHNHFQDDPAVIGRTVRLNKHPFTIVGVAPPEFRGTLIFGIPDFFVPLVNQEQIEGKNTLADRRATSVFMALGHLKPGVTPQQAAADLNSIGAYLEKTYPRDHGATTFVLARPALYGNYMGGPMRAFMTGLMLLAGLILLAACANVGSLFAARASDRSRDTALRLALGAARSRIVRQFFTEAALIALAGGALGIWGAVALLNALIRWHPFPTFPLKIPVAPDANVYLVAVGLAFLSALLFGLVPIRQALRTDPYQVIKAGPTGYAGRRFSVRDALVALQVAICALLVTSSMVAMRGLERSLHSSYGFDPKNAMVVQTDLNMAGYSSDEAISMQKRMLDRLATIPGIESAGLIDWLPLSNGSAHTALVFTAEMADLTPARAAANAIRYNISPGYFEAAGTRLLAGRSFSWHDDNKAPRVAVINRLFATRMFGSASHALGGVFKIRDGTRIQVVGVVEDGKYLTLTEDALPAMFVPMRQSPSTEISVVVRSSRDPRQLAEAIRKSLHDLDPGVPASIESWNQAMNLALFPSRMATMSLGVLGFMGAMLAITGVFGIAAYSVSKRLRELGIRIAVGARPNEVVHAALGRALKLLAIGSIAGLALGIAASRVLGSIVYQATPRDPLVLAGAVGVMSLLGLLATWLPARRALSLDPVALLREE